MKKYFIFVLIVAVLFLSCELNPDNYELLTKEEACTILEKEFDDSFTYVSSQTNNADTLNKEIEFKFKTEKLGDEIITVTHSYSYDESSGKIEETFLTDYLSCLYINESKTLLEKTITEQMPQPLEYKLFFIRGTPVMLNTYYLGTSKMTVAEHMENKCLGEYVLVIKSSESETPFENKSLYASCTEIANMDYLHGAIIFDT